MAFDLLSFIGSNEWWFRPPGTPYAKAKHEIVIHIIETNFINVKTHKFLTLKDYWQLYIKNKGIPLDDSQAMLYLVGDVSYLLFEEHVRSNKVTLDSIKRFKAMFFPSVYVKPKPVIDYPLFDPSKITDEDWDEGEPKKKRRKKEVPIEELIGIDSLPELF